MPHLRILGTKSILAGDDIRVPLIFAITFRIIEVVFSSVFLAQVVGNPLVEQLFDEVVDQCLDLILITEGDDLSNALKNVYNMTIGYGILSFSISIIGLAEYAVMFCLSERGTPADPRPRRWIGPLCSINLTLTFYVRVGTFIFGMILASVYTEYCTCHDELVDVYNSSNNNTRTDSVRFLNDSNDDANAIESLRSACWMYESSYQAVVLGLYICQAVDVVYGIAYNIILFCYHFPASYVMHASIAWNVCCRCCLGCLSCLTCCSMGGGEALRSGELKHFASLSAAFFDGGGILDVTPSDVLVGLYITRLIHFVEEYDMRKQIEENGRNSIENSKIEDGKVYDSSSKKDHSLLTGVVIEDNNNTVVRLINKIPTRYAKDEGSCSPDSNQTNSSKSETGYDSENSNSKKRSQPQDILKGKKIKASSRASQIIRRHVSKQASTCSNLVMPRALIPVLHRKLSPENTDERYVIAEGARYISFAEAIYEWSIKDKTRVWEGTTYHKLHHETGDKAGHAINVFSIPGINEDDIVYANYNTGVVATPFAVVLDHAWKSVVVTIRGSATLDDMMTDLTLGMTELSACGQQYGFDGTDRYAHTGILKSAQWIAHDLLERGILDELLLDSSAQYQDYDLRFVGHSLGATAAVLVCLFLRQMKISTAHAVVYEPPGCSVSYNLSVECEQWTVSFVTGMDVIPRFCFESMADLRDEMLVNISRIKVPKFQINENRSIHLNHDIDTVREFLSDALYEEGSEGAKTKFFEQVCSFRRYQRTKMEELRVSDNAELFLPGRIIQLLQITNSENIYDDTGCRSGGENVDVGAVFWTDRDDYREIVLSRNFINDHLTESIKSEFEALSKIFDLQMPLVRPPPKIDDIESSVR
mmetsp:Transcript_15461/g.38489  ORF Transcript_15461/g.38489 Transcript_15461/m.38489 type:complete len:875 (-) Transcript_15461:1699-4323(-)